MTIQFKKKKKKKERKEGKIRGISTANKTVIKYIVYMVALSHRYIIMMEGLMYQVQQSLLSHMKYIQLINSIYIWCNNEGHWSISLFGPLLRYTFLISFHDNSVQKKKKKKGKKRRENKRDKYSKQNSNKIHSIHGGTKPSIYHNDGGINVPI